MTSAAGDFDADDALDVADIDMLAQDSSVRWRIHLLAAGCRVRPERRRQRKLEDHRVWVKDLKHTWFGDADLNGEFNSNDFVQVFQAGKYEQGG